MKKMTGLLMAFVLMPSLFAQTITLKAKDYDGKTQYFVQREASWEGESVWGIKGEGTTGEVHTGDMWFNSFPGATAEYTVEFGVVLEPDGDPEYAVSMGATLLKKGRYPYPSGQSTYLCDGGSSEKHYINLGDHTITSGAKINVWGKSLYYCGSGTSWHGAYTRWFELKFTKVGGTTATPTDITYPAASATLEEGKEYTLTADGENVSWSYDANSDGLGSVDIGTGNSIKFTIPTGVTGDREITFTATGDNGSDAVTCNIGVSGIPDAAGGIREAWLGIPNPCSDIASWMGKLGNGARLLDMTGQQVDAGRITGGIYLVQYRGTVQRVMVTDNERL